MLVNCAGFAQEIRSLEVIGDDDWQRMLHVHLGGTYNTCRVLGPRMRERGGGAIVNISSEPALTGSETMPHYCAAKGAIVGLTKALALELAPQVRVNSVAPGPTDTPLLTDLWRGEEYLRTLPVPRLATPREIGETVAFLASEDAAYITAQVVSPNSGTVDLTVALVTGAAGGIGRATADLLEERGYTVARNDLPGQRVAGYAAPADVADSAAVDAMVARVRQELVPSRCWWPTPRR